MSQKRTIADEGGGGVQKRPHLADIMCEQPRIVYGSKTLNMASGLSKYTCTSIEKKKQNVNFGETPYFLLTKMRKALWGRPRNENKSCSSAPHRSKTARGSQPDSVGYRHL